MVDFRLSAISPRFYREARDIGDFVDHFGIHKWRFVADLPESSSETWIAAFQQWLGNLPPAEALFIKNNYLFKGWVRDALAKAPYKVQLDGKSWVENVRKLPPGSLEFCVGDAQNPAGFADWLGVLHQIRAGSKTQFKYLATAENLASLISPLLRVSPSLYIVDPYALLITKSDFEVFCCLVMLLGGTPCYRIHVITRDFFSAKGAKRERAMEQLMQCGVLNYQQFEGKVKEQFVKIVPKDRELFVHLVDDSTKGANLLELHKRYALSKAGGLLLDKGITVTGRQQDVACVDRITAESELLQYQDHVERFDQKLPVRRGQLRPHGVRGFAVE